MLTPGEIKTLIDRDASSEKKQQARKGRQYYECAHDIKDYRIFFVNADGKIQEDKTKSNIKISHPFLTELIDQKVQYMLSGKEAYGGYRYLKSDIPELQDDLDERFNENDEFNAELYEALTEASVDGFAYMYAYKDEDEKTAFQCADSMGVVEVRKDETADGCDYVIYHYVDRIGPDNKKIKRIQVWDKEQTFFYCQVDNGDIVLDESQEINPRPHVVYTKEGDENTYYEGFGFIPFFVLQNNRKQLSDLKPIKELIDDYDLMSCGLSNNIQDANETLYVVKGFDGELDEMMLNMKAKKHIAVPEGGDVEIRTIDIPYQARQAKLELDEKNIYRFGMGFNAAQLGDGNITNIVIKSRYALLDLKCNKMELHLKNFFRKILKVVLKEINDQKGTDYMLSDVYFDFKREVMTNAADNAQIEFVDAQKQNLQVNTLLSLASKFDNETLMQNICDVLDIDYEEIKDKLPKQEEYDPYSPQAALDAVVPEGDMIE